MSNMKPCLNPQVCGVQNHRPGTVCAGSQAQSASSSSDLKPPASPTGGFDSEAEFNGQVQDFLEETELGGEYVQQPVSVDHVNRQFVVKAETSHVYDKSKIKSGDLVRFQMTESGHVRPMGVQKSQSNTASLTAYYREAVLKSHADEFLKTEMGSEYDNQSLIVTPSNNQYHLRALNNHQAGDHKIRSDQYVSFDNSGEIVNVSWDQP